MPLPYGNMSTQRLVLKVQKAAWMDADMLFDVYLSDTHHTGKVAICCGEAEN